MCHIYTDTKYKEIVCLENGCLVFGFYLQR